MNRCSVGLGVCRESNVDDAIEKSAMRKIYLRLLPFAIFSYFLAYIDRINVSFAGLTMQGDLQMSAAAFGFAAGTFYWGYFIFEVPSNVILEKVGARLWIARIMISWGVLAGITALVSGTASFATVRFFLASCCISPTGSQVTIMRGLSPVFCLAYRLRWRPARRSRRPFWGLMGC